MSTRCCLLVPVLGCLLLGCNRSPPAPSPSVVNKAVEEAGDNYWDASGGTGLIEGDNCGFIASAIMFGKDHRPVVWFGLLKLPKEKSKFLYMLLFKSPENAFKMSREIGTEHSGPSLVPEGAIYRIAVTGKTHLKLDDKRLETSYEAEFDRKTNALIKEVLKLGGTEIKPGEPRVFLVDLTEDKVSYRPVKADLPDEVPEATSSHQTWGPPTMRALEQLKKKSPEVKSFLEEKPKR
jgi:hypothetical protein